MTTLEQVRAHRPNFDQVTVEAGEVLALEGRLCHQFFIVVEGRLETCRGGVRGKLVAGDGFGWAAMRDRGVNEADVRALTDGRLLVMSHHQFSCAYPLALKTREAPVARKGLSRFRGRIFGTFARPAGT